MFVYKTCGGLGRMLTTICLTGTTGIFLVTLRRTLLAKDSAWLLISIVLAWSVSR